MISALGSLTPAPVALALAAAVVTAIVAVVALWHRSAPGAGWLAVVMVVDALVVSFAVKGYAVPWTRQAALAVGGIGLLAAVPFVAFVVAYTGRGRHLTVWSLLGYGGPLFVAAALFATTQYHGLVLERPIGVHRSGGLTLLTHGGYGPLVTPTLVYVGLLLAGTLMLVLQTVVRHDRLYLGQSAALFVGAAAPLAAAVPSIGGFSRTAGATGPRSVVAASVLMGVAGIALSYAAARHRLFDFVPAIRQLGDRAAVADLDEGLLIADDGDTVVKLNAAAEAVLDCEGRDVVGSPAAGLFERVGVDDLSATPTTFEVAGGTHEVTRSPITDERDRPLGRTYVIRDVTRRERRKQRLQVLNRVLRHNVRNDMSVVRANAGVVAEEGGDRLAQLGENMVETADKLVEMGEKVRRTEQLLAAEELAEQAINLPDLVDAVVDEAIVATDHRAVDATIEVADGAAVAVANHSLLELALENVVENAIIHNDAPVPTLAVTADRAGDDVRLTVADDGPGIPGQEVTALEAGRETDLQHASSLGLWLVLWSVERLGGDLHIEHLDPTGTAVAIRLPDAAGADPVEGDTEQTSETGQDADATTTDAVPAADGVATDGVATEGATVDEATATDRPRSGDGLPASVDTAAVAVVANGVATGESTDAVTASDEDAAQEQDDSRTSDQEGDGSTTTTGSSSTHSRTTPPAPPASASRSVDGSGDGDAGDGASDDGDAGSDGGTANDGDPGAVGDAVGGRDRGDEEDTVDEAKAEAGDEEVGDGSTEEDGEAEV